jgi:acyl-homoserine-lactone acylase
MDSYGENERGIHAMMLLKGRGGFTLDRLTAAAYDPFQPGLARLVPTLVAAYDRAPRGHRLKNRLAGPVAALRGWDARWSAESVPNSLATFWAEALRLQLPADVRENRSVMVDRMIATSPEQKLAALATAIDQLEADFGSWRTPWGQINRFQRLTGDIAQPFSDAGSSIPVGFTTGNWGSLAVFGARAYPGTRRWYGTRGNSFVAVVEFGPRVRARAVSAGGQSGDPASPHFNDQSERYATGNLRDVYFYPEQLRGHTERVYKPGR